MRTRRKGCSHFEIVGVITHPRHTIASVRLAWAGRATASYQGNLPLPLDLRRSCPGGIDGSSRVTAGASPKRSTAVICFRSVAITCFLCRDKLDGRMLILVLNKAREGRRDLWQDPLRGGVLMGLWYEMRPEDLDAGSLARSTTGMECRWRFGTRCDRKTSTRDL